MPHVSTFAAIVAAIPFVAPTAVPSKNWTVGQTVQTTSGPVDGHAASVAQGVSEYLGIPYAQPPVGDLRFQPPVQYNGTDKIDGANFGPACIPSNLSAFDADFPQELIEKYGITDAGRKFLASLTNPGIPTSEDCLTLNVWTKPQTGDSQKAVMMFIHGGSFVSGSSALPAYNGQFFADQEDVVMVTINYRLSIFGFPGNPLGTQNLGLLDQRMAVEWVRDNIAAFGGDPNRITLFGESAGGAAVDDYSFAWTKDPIVNGIILMSGTTYGVGVRTPMNAAFQWFNATSALGCGNAFTPPSQLLSCMRAAPAEAIAAALVPSIGSPIPNAYSPTIDNTIVFAPSTYRSVNPARLPMLVGNNDNEAGLFRLFLDKPDSDKFWHSDTQTVFNCPAGVRAAFSSSMQGNPTWRYRWMGVFPNTIISTTPQSGAYHDSETAVLFGNVDQSDIKNTQEEEEIGKYMRGAWVAFAKDPEKGLEGYDGWPMYQPMGETLVRIGFENKTGPNLAMGVAYDGDCTTLGGLL